MPAQRLSQLQSKNLDAAVKLARMSVENSQRVLALQTRLAKAVFDSTVSTAKAHASVRSPQDLLSLHTEYIQDTAKRIVEVARQVAEITNESRSEFSRVLTDQLVAGKSELTDLMQSMASNLPAGVPDVKKAVDQAMSMANAAFEQIGKLSSSTIGRAAPAASKAQTAAKTVAKRAVKKATGAKAAVKKAVAKPAAKPAAKKPAAKPAAKKPAARKPAARKPAA